MEITIYIPVGATWHSAEERPTSDAMCIVETDTGAMYFQQPVDGKFLGNVRYWMQIPERI